MDTQVESNVFFEEKRLHRPSLSKKIYKLQQFYVIISFLLLIAFILVCAKGFFKPYLLIFVGLDILIYLLITLPFDSTKNYKYKFLEDKIEYSFEIINYSKYNKCMNGIICINTIDDMKISFNKQYCYITGDINVIMNNELGNQSIELKKIRMVIDVENKDEIIKNIELFKNKNY